MDKEKLKKVQEDTSHFRNVNSLDEITPAMVHKHVAAEQSFREHLVDAIASNTEQLLNIQISMENKIDKIFVKLDENSRMTGEALGLARNVNETLQPLVDKLHNHEGRLDDLALEKARLQGGSN